LQSETENSNINASSFIDRSKSADLPDNIERRERQNESSENDRVANPFMDV